VAVAVAVAGAVLDPDGEKGSMIIVLKALFLNQERFLNNVLLFIFITEKVVIWESDTFI
jgi:hypothetical protein